MYFFLIKQTESSFPLTHIVMYVTMTSMSTSANDVRKYFFEQATQHINFLYNKL